MFPESLVRPLGHGYFPIESILAPYLEEEGSPRSPDVAASLEQIGSDPEVAPYLRALGDSPVCLIEGISSPRNGRALRRFLEENQIPSPHIQAIDLADMRTIFEMAGDPLDGIGFQVADASALGMIEEASVDLLVQDSLLNCAPHCLHDAIMREAARVLRPGGLGFINFTDHTGLAERRRVRHPLPGARIYGLRDLPPALRDGLWQGVVLLEVDHRKLTLVTAPHGNFEFYFPCDHVRALLERYGLQPVIHRRWLGVDRHGNTCHRHLTLVRRMRD